LTSSPVANILNIHNSSLNTIRMLSKVTSFFQETQKEFKRINWPTFKETRRLTFIVIGMSLGVALFLGILDFIFTSLLNTFFLA